MNEPPERRVPNKEAMKTKLIRNLFVSAVAMTFATPVLLAAATPSPGAAATAAASPAPPLTQRMQQLDEQLDSAFADTFRGFGQLFSNSAFAQSIDLRDQKDKYIVRIYVPDADTSKVEAKVEGNTLYVTASGEENSKSSNASSRYEQMISLPGPVQSDKMQIERKPNLVVVSLPKAPGAVANASAATSSNASAFPNNPAAFDQNIIRQMAQMQQRMNQMFANAFPDDEESGLTNDWDDMEFGSAVHLDDLKDRYVVYFNLPDKDLQNVQVKLENGQLRLTASEANQEKSKGATETEAGNYEQLFTLPGPVKEKGMKVERGNGTILVTVPKA